MGRINSAEPHCDLMNQAERNSPVEEVNDRKLVGRIPYISSELQNQEQVPESPEEIKVSSESVSSLSNQSSALSSY